MKAILYCHGGSDNRGCEAIVRTTNTILKRNGFEKTLVLSENPAEDEEVCLNQVIQILNNHGRKIEEVPIYLRAVAKLYNKIFYSEYLYYRMTSGVFKKLNFENKIALSIGGDHYCYPGGEQILAFHNFEVKKRGGISVLWGCSVESSLLTPRVVEDMKRYDAIFARESITSEALLSKGITKVYLHPDPAFTLDYEETEFSQRMSKNAVGINVSTYAIGKNETDNIGIRNYRELIRWIQENTDLDIYLIPHVFKSHSNDLETNQRLMDALPNHDRIIPVTKKYTAMQLKGTIRNCRFFVGARTHATIAAYSSCVPTLVVGYSVKANGIATDLFSRVDNYVVPVQDMESEYQLRDAFIWQFEHENEIRSHLEQMMPGYIQRSWYAGEKLRELFLL